MKTANREMLGAFANRRFMFVDIPEFDLKLRCQSLTEREKSNYETAILSKNGRGITRDRLADANRRLFALCVVDDKGERLFQDNEIETIATLDALIVSRVASACEVHVGMKDGDIGELIKNSNQITVDDSNSD